MFRILGGSQKKPDLTGTYQTKLIFKAWKLVIIIFSEFLNPVFVQYSVTNH